MVTGLIVYLPLAAASVLLLHKIRRRLQLSQAKHRSLRGHSKWSRRLAALLVGYQFAEDKFYCCDGAPPDIAGQRRTALRRLKQHVTESSPLTLEFSESLESSIPDLRFTTAYRVPFPFRHHLDKALRLGSIVTRTRGVQLSDLDGNWRYDLAGSYGVNVFGYDFYKECMAEGAALVGELGPVLGPYHPVIRENVEKIREISGLDEVSFHMSGTEAVMQAVRLARYHTGRSHLVRLCGAYHGWWDGVQPGVGNQRKVNDVYTLKDLSADTLRVLRTRNDIACVLINPLQALHPNSDAASDAGLINSNRSAQFDRQRYTSWLQEIRRVCTEQEIVLIFDEVFTGFRLDIRGAQAYFGIQADMVTYGKTLGGGFPVGVVCGRHHLMKRFREDRPAHISFARGTFNSHPSVMAAMNVFLKRIEEPFCQAIYQKADRQWNERASGLNQALEKTGLPVRVANLHSVFTILYTMPGRYHWMFQFYLRREGLELSWIGSGRLILSLNYSDDDFEQVTQRFVRAAQHMQQDGWWWASPDLTDKSINSTLLKEMLQARFPAIRRWFGAGKPAAHTTLPGENCKDDTAVG